MHLLIFRLKLEEEGEERLKERPEERLRLRAGY